MIGLSYGNFQAVTTAPFSFGNALQFDGVNDYVSFSEVEVLNGTLSFWINLQDSAPFVFSSDGSPNLSWVIVNSSTNELRVRVNASTNQLSFTSPITINTETWYHCVYTFHGDSANTYVNGFASGSNPQVYGTSTQSFNMDRIARLWSTANYYEFIIDELAVWDTILTPTQITNLYGGGNGDYATNYSPDSLLAYYRCNEEDGATTLIDEQGNYNGTLNNFSTPPAYFIPH